MLGDCIEKMAELEDNSVDSIVCDPPYEIGFMAKKWDNTGIANNVEMWKQVFRILKPGGHLLAFGGTRTYHRMTCAIEDAGFEIRDCLMWVYGVGFPKSHNIGKTVKSETSDWEGWGTGLKPSVEPIVMARKPFKGTIADNVLKYKTGGLNIDACRISSDDIFDNVKPRDITKLNTKRKDETEEEAKIRKNTVPQEALEKLQKLGRWPANVLHDGSEEVINLFPNNAARFFYSAKVSKKDRNEGCEDLEKKQYSFDGRETPIENAYQRNNSISSNNHPTVKPTELMRYLCRLVTPINGIVLDPFMGSGSTGKAALLDGFSFIGIEMNEDYFEIAKHRIKE